MNLVDLRTAFLSSYAARHSIEAKSLREWCWELKLRVPALLIADKTVSAILCGDLRTLAELLTPLEVQSLSYVIQRVFSAADLHDAPENAPNVRQASLDFRGFIGVDEAPSKDESRSLAEAESTEPSTAPQELPCDMVLEARFREVCNKYHASSDHMDSRVPLRDWLEPEDQWPPFEILDNTAKEIIEAGFQAIRKRWAGQERILTTVILLERATGLRSIRPIPIGSKAPLRDCEEDCHINEVNWLRWCSTIRGYGAGGLMVALTTDRLRDLQGTEVQKKHIQAFIDLSLGQVQKRFPSGTPEHQSIVSAVANLATELESLKLNWDGSWRYLTPQLRNVDNWLDLTVSRKEKVSRDELVTHVIRPILRQLNVDLPERTFIITEKRVGIYPDSGGATLEEVANLLNVTRERIRQLEGEAEKVLRLRWPDVYQKLESLFNLTDKFGEQEALTTLQRFMHRMFGKSGDDTDRRREATYRPGLSAGKGTIVDVPLRNEVLQQWKSASRSCETPMDERGVLRWAGEEFPDLHPRFVLECVKSLQKSFITQAGKEYWFSDRPVDLLLQELMQSGTPMPLEMASRSFESDARSTAARLGRDLRFLILEDDQVVASEVFGLRRTVSGWCIELENGASLSLAMIVDHVCYNLSRRGIVDATIWGVYRFVNELMSHLFAQLLPQQIDAVILAQILLKASDSRIRPMRRRRLRWDSPGSGLEAKGKLGWVNEVVERGGVPVTITEISALLSEQYQDYERWVIQNLLVQMSEEDGTTGLTLRCVGGVSKALPALFIPRSWVWNRELCNVSFEIKRRCRAYGHLLTRDRLNASDLAEEHWIADVVEDVAKLPESDFGLDLTLPEDFPDAEAEGAAIHGKPTTRSFEGDCTTSEFAYDEEQADGKVSRSGADVTSDAVTRTPTPQTVRQAAIVGLLPCLSLEQLRTEHFCDRQNAVFSASLDLPPIDLLAYVVDRIRTVSQRLNKPWSLIELGVSGKDLRWFDRVIQAFSPQVAAEYRRAENRFPQLSIDAQIGIVLLLHIVHCLRRSDYELGLWQTVVKEDLFSEDTKAWLFVKSQPNARLKQLIEAAAVEFDLRRAFGDDNAQEWYQSVLLQFAFSEPAVRKHLRGWLSGQPLPVSANRLLNDPRYRSDSFRKLWTAIKDYHNGAATTQDLKLQLETSYWISQESRDFVLSESRNSLPVSHSSNLQGVRRTAELPGSIAGEKDLFDSPVIDLERLKAQNTLEVPFRVFLTPRDTSGLVSSEYQIRLGDRIAASLHRQENGSYAITKAHVVYRPRSGEEPLAITNMDNAVVVSQQLMFWDTADEVTAYELRNGHRIDPWSCDVGGCLLIFRDDLGLHENGKESFATPVGRDFNFALLGDAQDWELRLRSNGEVVWQNFRKKAPGWLLSLKVDHTAVPRDNPKTLDVRVSHPLDVEVTAIRHRGVLYECTSRSVVSSAVSRIPIAEPRDRFEHNITVLARSKTNGSRGQQKFKIQVRPERQLWRRGSSWSVVNPEVEMDAADFSEIDVWFWHPTSSVADQTWHVFEGLYWVDAVRERAQKIQSLAGWGAPVELRAGPYNCTDQSLPVLRGISNHGCISELTGLGTELVRIGIRRVIYPGPAHRLIILTMDQKILELDCGDIRVAVDEHVTGACTWLVPMNVFSISDDMIAAVAISYERERLGAWWLDGWFRVLERLETQSEEESTHVARLCECLRWLHLPLLAEDSMRLICDFVRARACDVLPAWLTQNLVPEFVGSDAGEQWFTVVRRIFGDWRPRRADAVRLDQVLDPPANNSALPLFRSTTLLNQISPVLAVHCLRENIANRLEATPAFKSQRTVLLDAIIDQLLKSKRDRRGEAKEELYTAVSLSISPTQAYDEGSIAFVRDGLVLPAVECALDPLRPPQTEWERSNIEVAMRLAQFRTLVLVETLERLRNVT